MNDIPITTELFTMQGGMDKTKLPRFSRLMINMLIKGLSAQKERSESDDRMLELLQNDANYVSAENTTAFMQWYRGIEEVKA